MIQYIIENLKITIIVIIFIINFILMVVFYTLFSISNIYLNTG